MRTVGKYTKKSPLLEGPPPVTALAGPRGKKIAARLSKKILPLFYTVNFPPSCTSPKFGVFGDQKKYSLGGAWFWKTNR